MRRGAVNPGLNDFHKNRNRFSKPIKHRQLLQVGAASERPAPMSVSFDPDRPDLETGEAWTATLCEHLAHGCKPNQQAWNSLLQHASRAKTAKPSQKWLKEAAACIEEVGSEQFTAVMIDVLESIGKPGTPKTVSTAGYVYQTHPTQIHDTHADLLRGLIWCTSAVNADARLIQAVGDAAAACFKKLPGIGPRAPKIGNACLHALAHIDDLAAVAQLSRLKTQLKHASARKQLNKALERAAENAGISPDDLEEIAVPTCGMGPVGQYRQTVGQYTALLCAWQTRKPSLVWLKPDGKTQKSVPAAIKNTFAAEIKQVKQVAKQIEKLLPPQRDRIEQFYLRQRSHRFGVWRQRYLDHPLVGVVARRLIWTFSHGERRIAGIWHDGQIVDQTGARLDWPADDTRVELWHPIHSSVDEVLQWRNWLEDHRIRQPFKQAHREIYLLTDAERRTETYSNRFAAHILRQHQFAALCQQRGWRYALQGAWDSHNTPFLDLPVQGLRAEFWVDAIGDYGTGTAASGVFRYATTDQVRFYRMHEEGPMPLENVPPLVFSEVMRDVDLFVGVCSVGNDPNWADGGPDGRFVDYWQSYSFGDLSQSAQTRKAALERIVPRLKIANRCSFSDRFLIVRGDLRTYKIHLGSGNILMSPNDQYLCIVPDRGQAADERHGVFLPFEGDSLLSIILSKALLLADDRRIKDRSIVSQIRR